MDDYYDDDLYLRQLLRDAQRLGKARTQIKDGIDYATYERAVMRIAKTMFMTVRCKPDQGNRIFIDYLGQKSNTMFDMTPLKAAGDRHVFTVAPRHEAYFRSKASTHAKAMGLSSRVYREGIGLLRLEIVDPSEPRRTSESKGPIGARRKAPSELKYPFATLELVGDSALIEAPKTEHAKIRNAASQWATRYGWKLSCSAQPDGILVTRTA